MMTEQVHSLVANCSCPRTGDLTSYACICGCVVNGSNMSIIIILIQGYFAVFLSSVCVCVYVCVCVCVILCTELKWSVTELLSLPPSLLPFSPLGCLTMATAVVSQFIPIYHLFHDFYGVHTEVCVFLMIGLYIMLAWSGDRTNNPEARPQQQGNNIRSILFFLLVVRPRFWRGYQRKDREEYRRTGHSAGRGQCPSLA